MYKCTECGMEYEIKPDYCDCGNDEFTSTDMSEIEKKKDKTEPLIQISETETPKRASKAQLNDSVFAKPIVKPTVDALSLTIFIICIVLSIIVIFFLFNPAEIKEVPYKNTMPSDIKIPAIDKLWDDTAAKKAEPIKEKSTDIEKPVQTFKQKVQQVKPQKTAAKQATTGKKIIKPHKDNEASATEQTKKTEEIQKAAEEAKKVEEARLAAEAAKKAAEQVKRAEEAKKTAELAKQELAEYKTRLRNTLGKRIDFTRVVGDGDCTISFKIDSTGKLVNGAFAKQSSNITLNDAVYNAFMLTRNYNQPPSAYKNEIITLSVKFYNGNFEISLK